MAAFADYLDLQTAVVEYIGAADFVDVFPRLVQLAETGFNRKLRCKDQVTTATVTFTSGVAPLPSNVAEIIGLYSSSGYEYVEQPLQSVTTSGSTTYYAVNGSNLVIYGYSSALTLQYYANIPTLTTTTTTTNWLLTAAPALYLYATAFEAAKYTGNVELAKAASQLADMELASLQSYDAEARYSRARVRIAGINP